MNVDIFIPVRLDSTRLSKKHLKLINGKPSIITLVNRLKEAKKIRKIIVCTTTATSDDELVKLLQNENIEFFRGSENDLLRRFLDAAIFYKSDIIIDVEGDKIYTDPYFVDKIVDLMKNTEVDYAIGSDYNGIFNPENHLVHGLIPAGIRFSALEKICKLKKSTDTATGYKEFFILPNLFNVRYIPFEINSNLDDKIRLTIDYDSDYLLAKEIFSKLGINFNSKNVINLFNDNPELLEISHENIKKWKKNYKKTIMDFSLKSNS
tara:strand:- start:110 stop:901 length:792 start_codon:yes stop_codon:yes gene_type:complete